MLKAGRPSGRVASRWIAVVDPVTKQEALWDITSPKIDATHPDKVRPASDSVNVVASAVPELSVETGMKNEVDIMSPEFWSGFSDSRGVFDEPNFLGGDFFF
jgi:hypothetical protein